MNFIIFETTNDSLTIDPRNRNSDTSIDGSGDEK